MFVVSGCDGTEVFEFVEEPLDGITLFIEPRAEGGDIHTVWHRANAGPCPSYFETLTQTVTVVSAICQEYVTGFDRLKHISRRAPVMRLPGS